MLTPVLEILPASQLAFWKEEKRIPKHFVLYGGTALALRLGHRQSVDFDFFSSAPFDLVKLSSTISFFNEAEILQSQPDTITLRIDRKGPVMISFFGNLSFGQLAAPDRAAPHGIKIASLNDLMAAKLKVVARRAEAKDYIDIAAMIDADMSLARGLGGAIALFGPNFNPALPLKALTYFGDGDLPSLSPETREYLIAAVKNVHEIPTIVRQADMIG
jgi:hypothetical protein